MKRCLSVLTAILAVALALTAVSLAADEHPIKLEISCDSECRLIEAGNMSWISFTIVNDSDAEYTLYNAVLTGDILSSSVSLDSTITIPANENRVFTLENVPISEDKFDTPITFMLEWTETTYAKDDIAKLHPSSVKRQAFGTLTVERFVLPEMGITATADCAYHEEGESVEVSLTLTNASIFDMTDISIVESATGETIMLDKNLLAAQSSDVFVYTVVMGTEDMNIQPVISYNVKNYPASPVQLQTPVLVEYLKVKLSIDAQIISTSSEGTRFVVTVSNVGTHAMTGIQLYDEVNDPLGREFDLGTDWQTFEFTLPAASQTNYNRRALFHAEGIDVRGDKYVCYDDDSYEIKPYIEPSQVVISLGATLTDPVTDSSGSMSATLSFVVSNDSVVRLTNARLYELFDSGEIVIASYDVLGTGYTKLSREIELDGLTSLSFVLRAEDAAGNEYSTSVVTLDLSALLSAESTANPIAEETETSAVAALLTGLNKLVRKLLIGLIITVAVCTCTVIVLYALERSAIAKLPREEESKPPKPGFEADAMGINMGYAAGAQAHGSMGYVPPAKLLYSRDSAQRFAPLKVKAEAPALREMNRSVRIIEQGGEPEVRPLIKNEFIRIKPPRAVTAKEE